MFLRATILADITEAAGSLISKLAWDGHSNPGTGFYYERPRSTPQLSRSHWTLCRSALQKCFALRARTLSTSLGPWTRDPPRQWHWHFSPQEDRVYAKEGLLWRIFPRSLARTSACRGGTRYLRSNDLVLEPPPDSALASVVKQGTHYLCISTCAIFGKDRPVPPLRPVHKCSLDFERE
jgi:hypothetical protein